MCLGVQLAHIIALMVGAIGVSTTIFSTPNNINTVVAHIAALCVVVTQSDQFEVGETKNPRRVISARVFSTRHAAQLAENRRRPS